MSWVGGGSKGPIPRTAIQLYRDCLRAIRHCAARSRQAEEMRRLVRQEFESYKDEVDFTRIQELRTRCVEL
jgi:hypothetical protein